MDRKLRIFILATAQTGRMLEQALRKSYKSYATEHAKSEDEIPEVLSRFSPDLMIADLGLSIAKFPPELPVLCVADSADAETEALAKGASDFVPMDRIGRLAFAVNRIMEQIENQNERKKVREDLRKAEERYRSMIAYITDVLMLISPAGTILYAGPSTPAILGHSSDTFIGRNVLDVIHPFDKDKMTEAWNALLETPGAVQVVRFRARHKNGTWLWFEGTGQNRVHDPALEAVIANFHVIPEPAGENP